MGGLAVRAEGLREVAAQCAASSSRLASQVPAATAGLPTHASVSAVGAAYIAVAETAIVLSDRVRATSEKLAAAADRYLSTDNDSAQRLSAVCDGPVRG